MECCKKPGLKKKYLCDLGALNQNPDSDEHELQFEQVRASVYFERYRLRDEIEAPYLREIEDLTKQ
jgi:hypothetical protein